MIDDSLRVPFRRDESDINDAAGLIAAGESIEDVAAITHLSPRLMRKACQQASGADPIPGPQEVAERAAVVRGGWDAETLHARRCGWRSDQWQVPTVDDEAIEY